MTKPDNLTRKEISVRFLPSGKVQRLRDSLSILGLAQEAKVSVYNTCNGVGTCGKCVVQVNGLVSTPTATEKRFLSNSQLEEGWRLACQVWPKGPVTVNVPAAGPQQILTGGLRAKFKLAPNLVKRLFTLPEPTLEDQTGDYERACRELSVEPDVAISQDVLGSLSQAIRPDWKGTALVDGKRIIGIEPGDTTNSLYGVAFDIGTTTLVGYLHNLWTGEELAVDSDLNPQVAYGADVISRIQFALDGESGLLALRREVCNRLNKMIKELASEAGIDRKSVYCVSVAGNSVMQHLFLGIDPRNIAFAPFIPVVQTGLTLTPAAARMDINPTGRVYIMPSVASYVGGDIVGDILATRLWRRKGAVLLVDIGTNGEIVLAKDGDVYACAAPAGPCFEGASISCGMRAVEGAISSVRLTEDQDFDVQTIGNAKARGFCGSGLIDAVAVLLSAGLVDESGRLCQPNELPANISPALAKRVRKGEKLVEVVFAHGHDKDIVLTQGDIRELQNAKGSIGAGVEVICRRLGVEPTNLDAVLLAGAFGNFVNPESARRIGLLPNVPVKHIQSVGNAAGVGAQMALLSRLERNRAQSVRHKVRYVELSGTMDFRDAYMEAMFFPEA